MICSPGPIFLSAHTDCLCILSLSDSVFSLLFYISADVPRLQDYVNNQVGGIIKGIFPCISAPSFLLHQGFSADVSGVRVCLGVLVFVCESLLVQAPVV